MKTFFVTLPDKSQRTLTQFMRAIYQQTPDDERERYPKFKNALRFYTCIMADMKVNQDDCMGMMDVIGGYCAAMMEMKRTEADETDIHELMAIAQDIEAQMQQRLTFEGLKVVREEEE
jgi:hypothetical protein